MKKENVWKREDRERYQGTLEEIARMSRELREVRERSALLKGRVECKHPKESIETSGSIRMVDRCALCGSEFTY